MCVFFWLFPAQLDRSSGAGLAGAGSGCLGTFATPPGVSIIFPIDLRAKQMLFVFYAHLSFIF